MSGKKINPDAAEAMRKIFGWEGVGGAIGRGGNPRLTGRELRRALKRADKRKPGREVARWMKGGRQ